MLDEQYNNELGMNLDRWLRIDNMWITTLWVIIVSAIIPIDLDEGLLHFIAEKSKLTKLTIYIDVSINSIICQSLAIDL